MLVKKYRIYTKQFNTDLDTIITKLNYKSTSINKLINIVINNTVDYTHILTQTNIKHYSPISGWINYLVIDTLSYWENYNDLVVAIIKHNGTIVGDDFECENLIGYLPGYMILSIKVEKNEQVMGRWWAPDVKTAYGRAFITPKIHNLPKVKSYVYHNQGVNIVNGTYAVNGHQGYITNGEYWFHKDKLNGRSVQDIYKLFGLK